MHGVGVGGFRYPQEKSLDSLDDFLSKELAALASALEVLDLSCASWSRAALHAALVGLPSLRILLTSADGGEASEDGTDENCFHGMAEHPSLEYVRPSPYSEAYQELTSLLAACPRLKVKALQA